MRKTFLALFAVLLLLFAGSCKKCFTCANECVRCSQTLNGHEFSHTLCKDSFNTDAQFAAAISADSAIGFVCSPTTPTYSRDFCVNKPGEEDYPNYFNKGQKIDCREK